jgi:hypothetical protein
MPTHFNQDDFGSFVELLDEQFLQTSNELLVDFFEKLQERNSPQGINADFSYEFRLLEYGRQRVMALQDLNYFEPLTSKHVPVQNDKLAVRLAFELGVATAEHRLMVLFEDYIHDGVAMKEWRQAGLPLARKQRLRQGARSRGEILAAAKRLYTADPTLIRNDTETARRIQAMRIPALQKGGNQQLSLDAITRHLRAGRRNQIPEIKTNCRSTENPLGFSGSRSPPVALASPIRDNGNYSNAIGQGQNSFA